VFLVVKNTLTERPVADVTHQESKTFTDYLRRRFKWFADSCASFLNRLGLHPTTITILGLVGHSGAAVLAGMGLLTWSGILLLVMAPLDFIDGTMARMQGKVSRFGAFVDSVTDRYSEFVILGGLLVYYLRISDWSGVILVYLAAAGSLLVSYIRSKAEGLGFDCKVGILTRVERYIVLIPSLMFHIPFIGITIIAALTHLTALQRILYVRKQYYAKPDA
jgi:CDP-diacylglycerol--glycerol-3-phosphate 3-phosphatidyltransferase